MTKKIIVSGLVQGIGFRPFVAGLAESLNLTGQVKNLGGVVEIIIHGNEQAMDSFIHRLNLVSETKELSACRIDHLQIETVEEEYGVTDDAFHIVESAQMREQFRFLPADLPTCDRCIAEMHDRQNRRYRYPFISCTACGPRFSIQQGVPYDRETITMEDFPMCEACAKEYTQKGNIRRHAQTIACRDCGPRFFYISKVPESIRKEEAEAIEAAVADLRDGKIGAIKDIGGFHFAFSPWNRAAAMRLRQFKNRDKKPFAAMFLNVDLIKEYCEVSKEEERLLTSQARPIVLLKKKKDFPPEICKESDRIGALLPCNPLQVLLLEATGPLVMTSGNRGGEPILISEEEMLPYLEEGIDFVLTHNRGILTPLDDSIYQMGRAKEPYAQILRRARGLVPEPIRIRYSLKEDTFAAGGDLKSVFALGRGNLVYMSQHFGDLEDVRCMESRNAGRERMEELLEIHPKKWVCDRHPAYVSVQEAWNHCGNERESQRLLQVQHHHAHVASVIAEHGLEGKVLGIACDGTGYGTDGTIWGGEFLLCEGAEMTRVGHLSVVKLLGGDAGAHRADMTLLSYMLEARAAGYDTGDYFSDKLNQDITLQTAAWERNINTIGASSMGRLFDAAAAVLDICHENSYEGECAIRLEHFAHNCNENADNILHMDCVKIDGVHLADGVKLLVDMYRMKDRYSKEVLAYAFHKAVAEAITAIAWDICREYGVNQIVLGGGTFLNRILTAIVMDTLRDKGSVVCINEKVPCGDGGIALGQIYLAACQNESKGDQ